MDMAASGISFTPPKRNSLTHIPGDEGWPIIGKTLEVLADPKGHIEKTPKNTGWSIAAICSARPASSCSGRMPMNS